ncbi:MAG: dockerin type I domain-containing protein, partial [Phycisphaeraceae bacterium]
MKQLRHPNRLLSSALALPVLAFALLLFATAVPAAADGGDVSRWTFAGELDERRPSVAYRLHLKGERDIQAVLGDLAADAELQIVDQRGQVVHQGEAAGLNGRSLNTRLPAGKYQVRVAGEAPTGYNLAVTSAPVSLTDDDLQGDADAEGNHGNGKDKIKSAGNGNGHGNDGAPAVVSGDFNGDGLVDDRDVELFVRALTEPETFLADHPDLTETDLFQRGDINGDGKFDAADVAAFEQLVIAQRDEEDTPADDEPVDSDLAAAQLVSDDTAMVYESSSSAPRTLQTVPFSPRGNGGGNGGGTGHTGGQGGGAPTSGGAAAPSTPGPSSPDPTDDTQPSAPEQPVEPEPVEPQQPVEPEPVEPEQPVEPEPAETEQPVDPEPAEPEQPVEPEPAEPEQPVEPEPAEPEQPVEPEPVE